MKLITLFFSLFALNASADIFICNTTQVGAGYRIEVETLFNQPVARFKVVKWSSAPPPAFGEKVILQGRGDLEVQQRMERMHMKGAQQDYTKWIVNSPDLSINFTHYGVEQRFGKIATAGGGLPGEFSLNKLNVKGNVTCLKKK